MDVSEISRIFVKSGLTLKSIQNHTEKCQITIKTTKSAQNQYKKPKINQKSAQNRKILRIQKQMQRPKLSALKVSDSLRNFVSGN